MKQRHLLLLSAFLFPLLTTAQITLTKKNKIQKVDAAHILEVKTTHTLLLSWYDYNSHIRKKKYVGYDKYLVSSVNSFELKNDSLYMNVQLLDSYQDTLTGQKYTVSEASKYKLYATRSIKAIRKDTSFHFALSDITEMQVQTKQPAGGGFSIAGLYLFSALSAGGAIISAINGSEVTYVMLGMAVVCYGAARYVQHRVQWWDDFKIHKKKWRITAS
ncbi:hypothetical protein QNI16_32925 [Cytophagaceae bacterium YF14B1]|uniref:Uncharacterized protein n=1 Tax=Xanthocytophaga flava TaxID=3048013 RepID=A0AAE3UB25_9BACT|nr:hypothetical protein [Xanthocytophaga flavus]MDJ1485342.1 hypothetical protein [Xanthocytophaga flavus]